MADSKITALTAISTVDPTADPLVIVDVSDTSMAASGTTKKSTINQLLGAGGTATLASATITGDLTVATDRLKVVTASTAIQTGATTQLQVGTTSWPSTVIGKSGSRSLFGNAGEVIIWNETAAAIGNYSTLFVSAKTGAGATTMGGLQIRAGIENASNSDGFVSLWTSNNTAGGFVERYKIDSTGVATWSNVGGVAGTAMTLNSTGLLVGTTSNLTGANISSSKGLGTANIATNRFATVEYGSGAGGAFTTITVSFTVASTVTSVIIEALLTGFSGVYLDHVAARYSTQSPVVIRNNASAGTTAAALAVDGTGLIYTLTITTSVQNPVIKVKATAGGLSGSITLPVITFA